jgi:hypothetical protein
LESGERGDSARSPQQEGSLWQSGARHRWKAILSECPDQANARLHALSVRERARLAAILARLASPYESERAAAGLLASAFVAKHDLTWSHLTSLLQPLAAAPDVRPPNRGAAEWHGYRGTPPSKQGQALDLLT